MDRLDTLDVVQSPTFREAAPVRKRMLVLAYWYPPENTSGAQRPHRFVKHLRVHGYESTIVTASAQAGAPSPGAVHASAAARGWSGPAALSRAIHACERALPYADRLPWAPLAVEAARKAFAGERPSVILSTSPPVATHAAALALKRKFRVPWVADFRDPMLDNPFRLRAWGKPYDRALEALIFGNADAILANTDRAADAMRRRHPDAARRIHVLWNGYDPDEPLAAAPLPPRAFRSLVHLGSLYGGRHPGLLLAAMRRLVGRGEVDPAGIRVSLTGPVEPGQAWVADYLGDASPTWLECRNLTVSRAEAQKQMTEADYLLLLDLNERGMGLQVPAKLFEYVRIGRPILAITAKGSSSAEILANCGVPHVSIFDTDTEEEVDGKVLSFFRLPTDAVPPSEWFRREFDAVEQTRTLQAILASLGA